MSKWIILSLVIFTSYVSAERIQLIDITPEEAQRLITQQSLDLKYAEKLSEGSALGRSYNGKIIDSNDYTEEIYNANQFHGQDGLGRAIFGYTDNQQSRLEARNANGEVRGQYQYLDAFGENIEVQYWVDELGFHQSDNIPKYELQPVTETPEVKAARKEHERLWKAAAKLNGVDPDSNDEYSANAERLEGNNYDDDQELEGQVSNQHQSLTRYPILPYSNHIKPENARNFGKIDEDSVSVSAANINNLRSRFARMPNDFNDKEEEEVTSEPRGFFYRFDYPVPVISDRNARNRNLPEAQASENVETSADYRSSRQTGKTARLQPRSLLGAIVAEEVSDNHSSFQEQLVSSSEKPLSRKLKTAQAAEELKFNFKHETSTQQPTEKRNPSRNRGSIKFNSKTK